MLVNLSVHAKGTHTHTHEWLCVHRHVQRSGEARSFSSCTCTQAPRGHVTDIHMCTQTACMPIRTHKRSQTSVLTRYTDAQAQAVTTHGILPHVQACAHVHAQGGCVPRRRGCLGLKSAVHSQASQRSCHCSTAPFGSPLSAGSRSNSGTAFEAPRSCLSMCFQLWLNEFSSPVGFLTHRTAPQEDPTSLLFCVGIPAPPPGSLPCLPPLASGNCCSA